MEGKEEKIRSVYGEVMEENVEWLKRSIIIILNILRWIEVVFFMVNVLCNSIIKVTDMGNFKFILIFEDVEVME